MSRTDVYAEHAWAATPPPVDPTAPVPLPEARRRVGEALDLETRLWWWDADDIRMIAREWARGRAEVAEIARETDESTGVTIGTALGTGLAWWLTGSPFMVRLMTVFAVLFSFAFGLGRF
jgi:hypothetical protein